MAVVSETIVARGRDAALEEIASLYPGAQSIELIERRNASGQFSTHGHTFVFSVTFEAPDEEAPEELGDEEY